MYAIDTGNPGARQCKWPWFRRLDVARAYNEMRWFRTNRRFGSWCALLAIAVQIILSFGHAHRIEGFRSGGLSPQAVVAAHSQPTVEPGDPVSTAIGLPFEYCAICVVIKMGASTVPAEAPASGVPTVAGRARFAPGAEAAAWTLGRLLFQARAPPSA
jgi:hypothetical protein